MSPVVQSSVTAAEIDFATLESLASGNDMRLYAVLDACDQPLVPILVKQLEERAVSLYRGKAELEHASIAPYLVAVDGPVLNWIQENLWGQPWGFFAFAKSDLIYVRTHLRRFLMVDGPDGKELYFRFYDPRVLQPFVESAEPTKLARFYGPLDSLLVVDADKTIIEYKPIRMDVPVSTSASKLAFSQDNMESYADTRRTIFSKRLYSHISSKLIELGQRFQAPRLAGQIEQGILRALTYEMNAHCDIARYVEILSVHSGGFVSDRDPVPIQNILFDRRKSWSDRLDRLELHCQTAIGLNASGAR